MLKLDISEPVSGYMTRGIISIESSAPISKAAKIITETNAPLLIVMKNNKPVGTIAEHEMLLRTVAGDTDPATAIESIINPNIITISGNATIKEALTLMAEKNINHLIVQSKGKLIGVFSPLNLLDLGKVKIW
ncbi:MAG: cyclic nucleotide-binding/CBS domain-containing protein [Candidatus Hodarchaeota archaeon]